MQRQMLINKNNLRDVRFEQSEIEPLEPQQVLIRVDQFALTANNITYAVAGDSMNYWQFFPTEEGWGRIPVWGFGTVEASEHPDIAVGERLYGYFPMGTHLTITAGQITRSQLLDVSAHRAELAVVYNQLQRVDAEPNALADAHQMLYRPLFMTSWLLDDFLSHNDFFDAQTVILTSASSKTSIGLAFMLAQRENIDVVGLTSTGNVGFVEGLGCYQQVVAYDQLQQLDNTQPAVSVDMAGNGNTLAALHAHYNSQLKYSCLVGATHWETRSGAQQLAGPTPELFFAPAHIKTRSQEWGPGGLESRFADAWQRFTQSADSWIDVQNCEGEQAITELYQKLLDGEANPAIGYIACLKD